MQVRTSIITSLLAATVVTTAQAGWNRRIREVAVVPTSAAGKFDVHVVWTIELTPNSTTLNVGTSTSLFVGSSGLPLAIDVTEVKVDPGSGICSLGSCSGGCGSGYIDGIIAAAFLCIDSDNDGDCECSMPPITSTFPGVELAPGDVITAKLAPSTGALGEPNPEGNEKTFVFSGPRLWTREIHSAKLVPAGGTAGGFKIEAEGVVGWTGLDGDLNLTVELAASDPVDGADLDSVYLLTVSANAADPLACGGIGCGGFCGTWNGFDVSCFAGNPIVACLCGGGWLHLWFPDEPVEPGDMLTLKLLPAPGALPILPGLEDAAKLTVVLQSDCVGDLNGDGIVNGADLGKLLSLWGGPGAGDLNVDGVVNGADLGLMLSSWGPCTPQ